MDEFGEHGVVRGFVGIDAAVVGEDVSLLLGFFTDLGQVMQDPDLELLKSLNEVVH